MFRKFLSDERSGTWFSDYPADSEKTEHSGNILNNGYGVLCEMCGREAPTRYIELNQNIGALLVRFSKTIKGNLCSSCVNYYFRTFTFNTFLLGWWGFISFFVTPFFIINNIFQYFKCSDLENVPKNSTIPQLTKEAISKIQPFSENIVNRLNASHHIYNIANDIAIQADVTPGQVVIFIVTLINILEEESNNSES